MNKEDLRMWWGEWGILILLTIIIITGGYVIYYQVTEQINDCTANPLQYASNKFLDDYGYPLRGTGTFKDADGDMFIVEFNTTGAYVKNPNSGGSIIVDYPNYSGMFEE